MSTVVINGVSYQGSSVAINGSRVVIDGVEQKETVQGVVELRVVEGSLQSLSCSGNVHVAGKVDGNVSASGNVNCGDVGGNVSASGNVNCAKVRGNVSALGGMVQRG